jgi:polyhydroxyalkanoate synthesis regulator phasin
MSADADDTRTVQTSQITLERIDELISQLERAAEQLRSGELSADAAATVVEDCAALATEASGELERLARGQPIPGQDSLL